MFPMHRCLTLIVFSLVFFVLHASAFAAPDLQITLSPDPEQGTQITLEFIGDQDGETTLSVLPAWGGTTTEPGWFRAFAASDSNSDLDAIWDEKTLSCTVTHDPAAPITLSYFVKGNEGYDDVDDYKPLTSAEGVAIFTSNTLFLPERWFDGRDTRLSVSLRWESLDELQWTAYPTFGDRDDRFKPDRLREGMLVAGSFRSAAFEHGNSRFHVVELGQNTSFTPRTLAAYAKPMLSSVHDFVNDHAPSEYLITYAPAGEPIENGFALGGTAVTNAFAFYFDPSVDLDENTDLAEVVSYVLCHEYAHNWNGVLFWIDEPEFEYQSRWFIEGFTDFISRRAMYEAGVKDAAWYTSEMRRVHHEYNASPHRDLTNRDAGPRWLSEPLVSDMLYKRGELIALLIDQRVREVSSGKHSLRDLIRSLVQDGKRGEHRVSPDRVLDWVEQHTDGAFRAQIERLIEQGGAIPFPDSLDTAKP